MPDVLDLDVLDGVIQVSSDESIAMARRLAREEGIFCGISSGCNVAACLKLATARPDVRRVATIVNDNGLRYLSTELCGAPSPAFEESGRPVEPDAALAERLRAAALEVIR